MDLFHTYRNHLVAVICNCAYIPKKYLNPISASHLKDAADKDNTFPSAYIFLQQRNWWIQVCCHLQQTCWSHLLCRLQQIVPNTHTQKYTIHCQYLHRITLSSKYSFRVLIVQCVESLIRKDITDISVIMKDPFIGPQEFVVGYSKAPKQPQSSAGPTCHSHAMKSTGHEPATIRIAA